MASKTSRSYKIDFFVVTLAGERKNDALRDLLQDAPLGYTPAVALDTGADEKFQVRSIEKLPGGRVFKGVFGRCRFGEKPVQGTEDGQETDVELKPGHGLVEKNHFLFYADRNLLVYQRNASGSHFSRFQRYVNLAVGNGVAFEPILTSDGYARLIAGGPARHFDVSFQMPRDPSFYKDEFLAEAVKLVGKTGGTSTRIRIGVGRTKHTLLAKMKDAVATLARHGLAKVARVKLEDADEPIDLIADRIIENVTVPLQKDGRARAEDIYAALAEAEIKRADHLAAFFGR